jgi:hypothetical protein
VFADFGDTYVPHSLSVSWEYGNCVDCPFIALHVSSHIIAYHQELLNFVFAASGDTYVRHCLPVSWENQNFVYCPFISLHVSSDIIAHHQAVLNCFLQLLVIHTCVTAYRCLGRIGTEFIVPSLLYMFRAI